MEMQQRMQRELMSNPDTLRQVPFCPHFSYLGQAPTFALGKFMCCLQVLDNPVTQSLMSNPDVIRQMLESNPQMQEVFNFF